MTAKTKCAPAPQSLPKSARAVWDSVVADYPRGHFSGANLALLEQMCRAWALAADCDKEIGGRGLLIDGKVNPLLQVRVQAWAEVRACATKLRLAISSAIRRDAKAARPDPNAKLRKPWE